MKASKVTHRSELRIRVDFPYNAVIISQIKRIEGTKWSQTMGAWHIPYTKEAFDQLKTMFPEVEIINSTTTAGIQVEEQVIANPISNKIDIDKKLVKKFEINNDVEDTSSRFVLKKKILPLIKEEVKIEIKPEILTPSPTKIKNDIEIIISSRQIILHLPKNDTDSQFIRSFKYYRWDKNGYCWLVPNWGKNLELIRSYFKDRNVDWQEKIAEMQSTTIDQPTFQYNELLVINYSNRKLKIYFAYQREIVTDLKRIPFCKWNMNEHCWISAYAEKYIIELKHIAELNGLKFRNCLKINLNCFLIIF